MARHFLITFHAELEKPFSFFFFNIMNTKFMVLVL